MIVFMRSNSCNICTQECVEALLDISFEILWKSDLLRYHLSSMVSTKSHYTLIRSNPWPSLTGCPPSLLWSVLFVFLFLFCSERCVTHHGRIQGNVIHIGFRSTFESGMNLIRHQIECDFTPSETKQMRFE